MTANSTMKLRRQVIGAIFRRNFSAYFSGMLGYLFIIVFVVACGWYAFDPKFFTANEPNLDQLSLYYPMLMLFFIPAITMSVWADERKTGTDELLFTLPATDVEISDWQVSGGAWRSTPLHLLSRWHTCWC